MDYKEKVRLLLAKASSVSQLDENGNETNPETISLEEKAHALIQSKGLQEILHERSSGTKEDIIVSKFRFSAPNASNKEMLYVMLVMKHQCYMVKARTGIYYVYGTKGSIERIDFLYDILLQQIVSKIANTPVPLGESTRVFRNSFWLSFVKTVRSRIEAGVKKAVNDSGISHGEIVLASREHRVVARAREDFSNIRKSAPRKRRHSAAGAEAGRRAGAQAQLWDTDEVENVQRSIESYNLD